jgi:hypothetical protein
MTFVGDLAEGLLSVLDGGRALLEGGLQVGGSARGSVLVSMPLNVPFTTASTLSVTGETRVGDVAPGFLTVTRAIMHNIGDLRVGFSNALQSEISVVLSEISVQGSLAIGVLGPGAMTIQDSDLRWGVPTPECQTLIVGGSTPQASGVLTLSSSGLSILGTAQVGVGAGSGLLQIDNQSTVSFQGSMTIGGSGGGKVVVDGELSGSGPVDVVLNGRLEGTGTVTAPLSRSGGHVSPSLTLRKGPTQKIQVLQAVPGTLTIAGDYE